MELVTVYSHFQKKYNTSDDANLRRRLLAFPEMQLGGLHSYTLVLENAVSGIEVLKYEDISGLTYTNALDTLAIPRMTSPLTVARYYEERGKKLDHPTLPLLAVRRDRREGANVHYDHLPLERVYYRETSKPKKEFVLGSEYSSDEKLMEVLKKFTDVKPTVKEMKKPQPLKSELEGPSGWSTPSRDRTTATVAPTPRMAPAGKAKSISFGGIRITGPGE